MEIASEIKIRFIDCDPLGHLNNSRYIDYFFNAREDQIQEHFNMSFSDIAKYAKGSMVAVMNQIAYIKEVLPNVTLRVTSGIFQIGEKSAMMEMRMHNQEGGVHALMWTEFLWMDFSTRRAAPIPEKYLYLLEKNFVVLEQKDFLARRDYFLSQRNSKP